MVHRMPADHPVIIAQRRAVMRQMPLGAEGLARLKDSRPADVDEDSRAWGQVKPATVCRARERGWAMG